MAADFTVDEAPGRKGASRPGPRRVAAANLMDPSLFERGQFFFLASRAPNRVFFAVIAGILGGAAYAMLVPLLMMAMAPGHPLMAEFVDEQVFTLGSWDVEHPRFALAFLLLCAAALVARASSQIVFGNVASTAASDLRLFLSERICQLSIARLEALGSTRLVTAVTLDVPKLVEGASHLPNVLINVSTILCGLAFIAVLHLKIFLLVLVVIVLGVASYQLPMALGRRDFARARQHRHSVQECIRDQVYGAKELKLNAIKYESFMDRGMREHERALVQLLRRANVVFYSAMQYGNLIGFLAIGAVVFGARNLYELPADLLTGVVMAMLYIIGPIGIIVNIVPSLLQGSVALEQLRQLLLEMPAEQLVHGGEALPCDELRLDDVSYAYPGQDSFTVGPLSVTLRRGEVTFIVGGNGSGKSTLAKLISLHYLPTGGRVLFDGRPVDEATLFGARQSVSTVYLDFHLFSELYGQAGADFDRAAAYLHKLELAHKVRVENGRFSTTELSQGQRKRLALVVAMTEDRNIYVFDEWAADQDPEFKQVFYTELLPEFRRQNKIVVVVSHDDRYFDQADQLVLMERGQLVEVKRRHRAATPRHHDGEVEPA